jgi:hypothetical protein
MQCRYFKVRLGLLEYHHYTADVSQLNKTAHLQQ